jgi:hypothetical protein
MYAKHTIISYIVRYGGSIIDEGELGFAAIVKHRESGELLRCICSWGMGWEHVSVSKPAKEIPTWDQMNHVKNVFWADDEVVMQLHPAKENYINVHPGVLHLWKPIDQLIPTPPLSMV